MSSKPTSQKSINNNKKKLIPLMENFCSFLEMFAKGRNKITAPIFESEERLNQVHRCNVYF